MLFPHYVCAAFADSNEDPGPIHPDEAVKVYQNAVESRRREWSRSVVAAHTRRLPPSASTAESIPTGVDRGPVWPGGVVGSITHCKGFVGAVVASSLQIASIGFDVETATPLKAEELVSMICTPREQSRGRANNRLPCRATGRKCFSRPKESIHKCEAPLSGVMCSTSRTWP